MPYPTYPNNDQLYGTMISYGEYQLSYTPPERGIESRITMSISAEANLDQMLEIFLNFLRASGYFIAPDATLEIVEGDEPEKAPAEKLEEIYHAPRYWSGGYPVSVAGDTITF